jgi:hypothetical protein
MDTYRDPLKEEMKTALKPFTTTESAELRLKRLGVELSALPEPFGVYAEGVQTGNLLFLTGMLPTEGRSAKSVGRLGAELKWRSRAAPLASRRSMLSPSLACSLGRSTRLPALCSWASQWRLREMFATNRRSPTARRNSRRTSEKRFAENVK